MSYFFRRKIFERFFHSHLPIVIPHSHQLETHTRLCFEPIMGFYGSQWELMGCHCPQSYPQSVWSVQQLKNIFIRQKFFKNIFYCHFLIFYSKYAL